MNNYETIVIFHPDVEKDRQEAVLTRFGDIVAACEGPRDEIKTNVWGRRKLAYRVKKQEFGQYVLLNFKSGPAVVDKLAGYFRVTDEVIKYMTIREGE